MKICFYLGSLSEGGIGRVVSIIAKELAKSDDINASCLIYERKKDELYSLEGFERTDYLLDKPISLKKAILRNRIIKKTRDYLKCNKIEILIVCGDLFFPVAVLAAIGLKVKVLCWDHTAPDINSDQSFQYICRILGTKYSDYNLVLTEYALTEYNKRLNPQKNFQIYNPVDPDASRHFMDYNRESKKIISIGRLCYQKNFSRLLDIAKVVIERNPEWEWDVFGDGNEKKELVNKCRELKLDDNVHFLGQASDLYQRYPNYAFIVMTSRYEGFPMTLLEGSANALPLVAFDVKTGPNEIIINGYNGFLCDEKDDSQMIDRIQRLIDSDELRTNMSANSLSRSKDFDINKIIKQWIKMLYKIIED